MAVGSQSLPPGGNVKESFASLASRTAELHVEFCTLQFHGSEASCTLEVMVVSP